MSKHRRDTTALAARSHSTFQNRAHTLLSDEGFLFERRTAKDGNIYHHPDGRRINVNATPRNEGNSLEYLRQSIKSPRLGLKAGESPTPRKEDPMPTTINWLDLASDFLKSRPMTAAAKRDRAAAYVGWVRRVVEHGPILASELLAASLELGYPLHNLTRARQEIGCVAYVIPGAGAGLGKGGNPTWVCMPKDVPSGASMVGRKSPRIQPLGENNGQAPDPREEPDPRPNMLLVETPDTIDESAGGDLSHPLNRPDFSRDTLPLVRVEPALDPVEPDTSPLTDEERTALAMGGVLRDIPDDDEETQERDAQFERDRERAMRMLDPNAVPFEDETARARALYEAPANPEVLAAAQMLLESLGLKVLNPEGLARLERAYEALSELEGATISIRRELELAVRMLT